MMFRTIWGLFGSNRARLVRRLMQRGLAEQNQNRFAAAIACYREALEQMPDNGDVLCLLGTALQGNGERDAAVAVLRRAVTALPGSRGAWLLLASALPLPECSTEAVKVLGHALALGGDNDVLKLNYRLAQALRDLGEYDAAIKHFEAALAVHGDTAGLNVHAQLANLLHACGRADEARERYREAWEINRDDVMLVRRATILPPIPQSASHILRIREELARNIDELLHRETSLGRPEQDVGHTDFYLAYHGLDDRLLRESLARMYSRLYPRLRFTSPHLASVGARTASRFRIGLISDYLRIHTIGRLMLGFFRHIEHANFEINVYSFSPPEDAVACEIRDSSDNWIVLDRNLESARSRVANDQLDLILYCDLGMNPLTYFMGFARLAPVQCVTWGHPVTSGLPEIDYFISSELVEPGDGRIHYSEMLECLPASCGYVCYPRPALSETPTRAEFGLATDANVYVCPQSLFKIHPDFDAILEAILARDPRAILVLISTPDYLESQLVARWKRTAPNIAARTRFLPFCDRARYLGLLAASDVVLDTPHFSGGNSSLEALAVGTPVVTLPGAFARSRFTYADYRRLGVMDCVAQNADTYIDTAVRLGTDRAYNAELRKRILAAGDELYDDVQTVRALERFFANAISRARSRR